MKRNIAEVFFILMLGILMGACGTLFVKRPHQQVNPGAMLWERNHSKQVKQ